MSTRTITTELNLINTCVNVELELLSLSIYALSVLPQYRSEYLDSQFKIHPDLRVRGNWTNLSNAVFEALPLTERVSDEEVFTRVARREEISGNTMLSHNALMTMAESHHMDYHGFTSICLRGKALHDNKLRQYVPRSNGKKYGNAVSYDLITDGSDPVEITSYTEGVGSMYTANLDGTIENDVTLVIDGSDYNNRTKSKHFDIRLKERGTVAIKYVGSFIFDKQSSCYRYHDKDIDMVIFLDRYPIIGQNIRAKIIDRISGEALVLAADIGGLATDNNRYFTNIYEITTLDNVLRMLTHQKLFSVTDFMITAKGQNRSRLGPTSVRINNKDNEFTGLPRSFNFGNITISDTDIGFSSRSGQVDQPFPSKIGMQYGLLDLESKEISCQMIISRYVNFVLPKIASTIRLRMDSAFLHRLDEGLCYILTNNDADKVEHMRHILSNDNRLLYIVDTGLVTVKDRDSLVHSQARAYSEDSLSSLNGLPCVDYRTVLVFLFNNGTYSIPLIDTKFCKQVYQSGDAVSSLYSRMNLLPPMNTILNKECDYSVIPYDSIVIHVHGERDSDDSEDSDSDGTTIIGVIHNDCVYFYDADNDVCSLLDNNSLLKDRKLEVVSDKPSAPVRRLTIDNYTSNHIASQSKLPGKSVFHFKYEGLVVKTDKDILDVLTSVFLKKRDILSHANTLNFANNGRYMSGVSVIPASFCHKSYFIHMKDSNGRLVIPQWNKDDMFVTVPSSIDVLPTGYNISKCSSLTLDKKELECCVIDVSGQKLDPSPIMAALARYSQRVCNKRKPFMAMTCYHTFFVLTYELTTTILVSSRSNTSTAANDSSFMQYNTRKFDSDDKMIFEKIKTSDVSIFTGKKPLLLAVANHPFVAKHNH